jgi:murein DD-endopeptidase / murein LD-carboxypeptidase
MNKVISIIFICVCVSLSAYSQLIERDGDTYDPDTLRYQYHAQKVGIDLDTNCNLELYRTVYDWLGTPYRFGGSGKKGIDCSGFTGKIYESVYNHPLARDSRSMFQFAEPVAKSQLKEGDLVFFKIYRGRISHVGVYLGNNKFVHASTTRGVIISDLNEDYYRRYYYKGGRVLRAN